MSDSNDPVGRREQRKIDRRQAIVVAARASFVEHGYAGTSMSGLLKELGGSKATLWGYFRSKEELFAAVIDDVSVSFRGELETALSSDAGIQPTLVSFCRAFLHRISTPEAVATWRMVVAESGRFPELGRIFYERAAGHTQVILSTYLSRQIAEGRLRAGDATRMADTLIDLCAGQQTRRLWSIEGSDVDQEADTNEYIRIFLSAFGNNCGSCV